MMKCDCCGRVGTRGFSTEIRMHSQPHETLCTNTKACHERVRKAILAKATLQFNQLGPHSRAVRAGWSRGIKTLLDLGDENLTAD